MGKLLVLIVLSLVSIKSSYSDSGAGCPAGKVWSASAQACVIYVPADQQQNVQIINRPPPPPITGDSDIDDPEHGTSAYYRQQKEAHEAGKNHKTTDSDRWDPVIGDQQSGAAGAGTCAAAHKNSYEECEEMSDAATLAIINQLASSTGNALGSTGSARGGCAGSAAGGGTAMSSTLYVAYQCYRAAENCLATCKGETGQDAEKNKTKIAQCQKHKQRTSMAGIVGASQLTALIGQATACERGLNAGNTPGFTPPPLPSNSITDGSGSPTVGAGTYTSDFTDDDNGPTYDGTLSKTSGSKGEATGESGGGGGPQGGAYPGGAPNNQAQAGGSGAGPFKDPDRGFTSGGGAFSVSGVPTSGGGGYRGPASDKDKDGIDWSKFLPGGENDPSKRGLASADGQLAAKGITGANDLSNFEKVTRMMNRKRAFLKQ